MIIPKDVKGRNKIRDAAIIKRYLEDHYNFQALSEQFDLTETRCRQIIYRNSHLLQWDSNYEKSIRINRLQRAIKEKETNNEKTRRDIPELQDMTRKEIEGDKPLIDQSQNIYPTYKEVLIVVRSEAEIRAARKAGSRIGDEEQV